MSSYGFDPKLDHFIECCRLYPPDLAQIDALLAQGLDMNTAPEDEPAETPAYHILLGYPDLRDDPCRDCLREDCETCPQRDAPKTPGDGHYLTALLQKMLNHGLDLSRCGGAVGNKLLEALVLCSYDPYILDAVKLLLRAGADPAAGSWDGYNGLLEFVATHESAADMIHGDHRRSDLFYAFYEILDACHHHRDYSGISMPEACVGKTIFRAALCSEEGPSKGLFTLRTEEERWTNCFLETLVLWCGSMPLTFNRWGDGLVDPEFPRRAGYSQSVSDYFQNCIGHQITQVEYPPAPASGLGSEDYRPWCTLHLDNGRSIRFSTNAGLVPKEQTCGFFELL